MHQRKVLWPIAVAALAAALLSGSPAPSVADDSDQIGRLRFVHPWTGQAAAGETTRLHMKIVNDGSDDLHVVKVTSPIATRVRLVLVEARGQPVQLPSFTLFAHESMDLDLSHIRVSLEGLRRDLRVGEQFPVTLHMAPFGRITTIVTVGEPVHGGPS